MLLKTHSKVVIEKLHTGQYLIDLYKQQLVFKERVIYTK